MIAMDGTMKISDFGVSATVNHFSGEFCTATPGTYAFLPPELVVPEPKCHVYNVDVWAAAVTLFMMVVGTLPFSSEVPVELFRKIQEDEVKIPDLPEIDKDLRSLLNAMMMKSPPERLTSIDDILAHPWMQHPNDTDDDLSKLLAVVQEAKKNSFLSFVSEMVEQQELAVDVAAEDSDDAEGNLMSFQ